MSTNGHVTAPMPEAIPVLPDGIPAELTALPQWVSWQHDLVKDRWSKVPYNARSGGKAQSNNPLTFAPFGKALEDHRKGRAGVGFVFINTQIYVGIDLDACRNPETGELTAWAQAIVDRFNSYTDISPSGFGVKIVVRGQIELSNNVKKLKDVPTFGDKKPEIAIYNAGRFWCLTGHCHPGTPATVEHRAAELKELCAELWPQKPVNGNHAVATVESSRDGTNGKPSESPVAPSDDERAAICMKAMLKIPVDDKGDGSNRLLSAARQCVRFDISDGNALAVFRRYAAAFPFPVEWSDDDFTRRLRQAEKRVGRGDGLKASGKSKRGAKPVDVGNPTAEGVPSIRSDAGRTDLANGRRLRAMHGADALYVTDWGRWIVWDGQRYAEDTGPLMEAKAKRVAEVLFLAAAEALALSDRATMDAILSFCRYSSGSRGIANMITMARSEPGVGVSTAQLDVDPWLLNLPNGTLELKTITLRPHSQSDRLTKLCPTPYDADADCPVWRKMVTTITDHNEVLQRFLRRLAGYWLTGLVREHILPIFWGEGANGKSTYLGALLGMMGRDYAMKAAKDFLTVRAGEVHPTEQADLFGKRLAVAIETENGKSLAESLVKELTGADDIRARKMRQDFWQFGPTHKLVLATNHKPLLRGNDHAIWRRLKLTPFTVTIPDDEQDKSLPEKLKAENSGILNWCLLGLQEYMADGLGEPAEVTKATAGYRVEMDVLGKFFGDCCLVGNGYSCRVSDLYKHYHAWCDDNGEHAVGGRRFGMAMTEKGFERKTSNGVVYLGIGLLGDRPLTDGLVP